MNVLTFDIEEWFHLLDFDATRGEEQWKNFEVRIYDNVDRVLRILEDSDTSATFFIIGWVAKNYPDLVRRIAEKYQVGSHTMSHQLVWQQGRDAFREDVTSSVKLLEDITGKKVECFRAPGFSIRESEGWAFETLHDLGIQYDCSVFPAHHAHGGMASYPERTPGIIQYQGICIREFPVSFKTIAGHHLVFSGGGYFRLFPYSLIKKWSRDSSDYLLGYVHPRDLDPGQPVLDGLPMVRKFKSYVGLRDAENKLRRWLADFEFMDVTTAAKQVDWDNVPVVNL